MLKGDHGELLSCFPIHAVVFDPAGTEWRRPFNKKQNFTCFLINRYAEFYISKEKKPKKWQLIQLKVTNQQHSLSKTREKLGEIRGCIETV